MADWRSNPRAKSNGYRLTGKAHYLLDNVEFAEELRAKLVLAGPVRLLPRDHPEVIDELARKREERAAR